MSSLLTETDIRELLHLPSGKVRKLVRDSLIPHVRLPSGDVRFVEADLLRWIEQHKQEAALTREASAV